MGLLFGNVIEDWLLKDLPFDIFDEEIRNTILCVAVWLCGPVERRFWGGLFCVWLGTFKVSRADVLTIWKILGLGPARQLLLLPNTFFGCT